MSDGPEGCECSSEGGSAEWETALLHLLHVLVHHRTVIDAGARQHHRGAAVPWQHTAAALQAHQHTLLVSPHMQQQQQKQHPCAGKWFKKLEMIINYYYRNRFRNRIRNIQTRLLLKAIIQFHVYNISIQYHFANRVSGNIICCVPVRDCEFEREPFSPAFERLYRIYSR